MKCGLLGRKLGHSYSPQIHASLGNYTYDLFERSPEELEEFIRFGDYSGLNVTIPYKKAVIPFCDELSERARILGSVNTIVRREDGRLIGHNTDYFGFFYMLERSGFKAQGKKALVLGSGGASATAVAVLEECGADVIVISRSGENNYENIHKHADAAVIVNATPVGMYPNNGVSPLSLDLFPKLECVLDLIYNPARTQLLMDAENRGLIAVNGHMMLVAQAWESARWFTGNDLPADMISSIHTQLRKQMENILLIGMPGCGKSTVGKLLAEKLGRSFIDADQVICGIAGKTIPEIFRDSGEEGFRKIETIALERVGKMSGAVIATGGGCVTREKNYSHLHQNGTIYYLKRDIEILPTEGRPLSAAGDLNEMFRIRKPLYEAFADHTINNNATLEDAVSAILKLEESE